MSAVILLTHAGYVDMDVIMLSQGLPCSRLRRMAMNSVLVCLPQPVPIPSRFVLRGKLIRSSLCVPLRAALKVVGVMI